MGKYITMHGGNVCGFYNRTASSAMEAAQLCDTTFYEDLDSLIEVSDTLFITTTDRAIEEIWDCIAAKNVRGKVICHFSGSLSSDIFSNRKRVGVYACSLHPIYAFSNKITAYQNLTEAIFTVEGDDTALIRMQELFDLIPNRIVKIPTEAKAKYHAAASVAGNHVTGLVWMAVQLIMEAGIEEETSYAMLKPLVENCISNVFSNGCKESLTGPIERGDAITVKKHLEALEQPIWNQAYRAAGQVVAKLAQGKNPKRDYEAIEQLLRESE